MYDNCPQRQYILCRTGLYDLQYAAHHADLKRGTALGSSGKAIEQKQLSGLSVKVVKRHQTSLNVYHSNLFENKKRVSIGQLDIH